MATVSVTQIGTNDLVTSAGANLPHNQLAAVINGGLDDANISSLSGTKITSGTLPSSALDSNVKAGWLPISGNITSVTYNGNRSYSLATDTDNTSSISPGMRLRTTRTVAAPTQCALLNGTNQYFSKTSPAGMTATDDIATLAYIKLTSYPASDVMIHARGTSSGCWFGINSSGQVIFNGINGGTSNFSRVTSYQSIPLNKWVSIAAQLDMSAFTATTTTSYIMIDGVDVPASVSRSGTNPTSMGTPAGDFTIGAFPTPANYFPGKIAQVAIFNAKVSQATMRGYISQGLAGTETALVSAYSFSNSVLDLNTTNANNLTNNNSASITNADSPFGGQADGSISATLDYGIVQKITSTTITCQVAEGCTIPTSGGISAVSYATVGKPYGFPSQRTKWQLIQIQRVLSQQSSAVTGTWYNLGSAQITVPIGEWQGTWSAEIGISAGSSGNTAARTTLSTANNSESDVLFTAGTDVNPSSQVLTSLTASSPISAAAQTIYYLNTSAVVGSGTLTIYNNSTDAPQKIIVENAFL